MYIDFVEGHVVHELKAHHDHAGNPEEDDVKTGNQDTGWIVGLQFLGVLRPAQCREGPQCGREPGIEYVFILVQGIVGIEVVFFTNLFFTATDIHIVFLVIPGGDSVPPPDLSTDTPVLDITHPLEVGVFPVVRYETDFAGFNRLDGGPSQGGGLHKPLVGKQGFDNGTGTVATWLHQLVVIDFFQQILCIEVSNHAFTCLEPIQADIGSRKQLAFIFLVGAYLGIDGHDVDQTTMRLSCNGLFVAMALPDLVIVKVMGRGDLDATGTKLGIDIVVGNNRDASACQRQFNKLTQQVLVAFVTGVDSNSGIAQHGFWSGGGDDKVTLAI